MRKATFLNVVVVTLLGVSVACGGKRFTLDMDELGKKEWIVLAVGMHNNKCKLVEKEPGDIRTDGGGGQSFVNWVVVGYCPAIAGTAQRIAIDPNSFDKGKRQIQSLSDRRDGPGSRHSHIFVRTLGASQRAYQAQERHSRRKKRALQVTRSRSTMQRRNEVAGR